MRQRQLALCNNTMTNSKQLDDAKTLFPMPSMDYVASRMKTKNARKLAPLQNITNKRAKCSKRRFFGRTLAPKYRVNTLLRGDHDSILWTRNVSWMVSRPFVVRRSPQHNDQATWPTTPTIIVAAWILPSCLPRSSCGMSFPLSEVDWIRQHKQTILLSVEHQNLTLANIDSHDSNSNASSHSDCSCSTQLHLSSQGRSAISKSNLMGPPE